MRKELGMPVEELTGAYGEFTVLVDGRPVVSGGPLGWMGVLPTTAEVLAKVRARLGL